MIQKVLVVGAGSAGLLAAISLKKKIPQLSVRVVRSPAIGVIGVGESTTPQFPKHLLSISGSAENSFTHWRIRRGKWASIFSGDRGNHSNMRLIWRWMRNGRTFRARTGFTARMNLAA